MGWENVDIEIEKMSHKDGVEFAKEQVKDIVGRVWPYILVGVGIGAGIHNWVPQSIIERILGKVILLSTDSYIHWHTNI